MNIKTIITGLMLIPAIISGTTVYAQTPVDSVKTMTCQHPCQDNTTRFKPD